MDHDTKAAPDMGDYAWFLLRVVTGIVFLHYGTAKILGFPDAGPPPDPMTLKWIAGWMEIVGGLLIIGGLFTRITAFLLSGQMAVAYWMVHAPQSTFPMQNGGTPSILFCFIFLALAAMGAGPLSLDAKMKRKITGPGDDADAISDEPPPAA